MKVTRRMDAACKFSRFRCLLPAMAKTFTGITFPPDQRALCLLRHEGAWSVTQDHHELELPYRQTVDRARNDHLVWE
jgi:hypothetical protein